MKNKIQKISTMLWFDTQAEEAARFYTSVFKNSKLGRITHYGKVGLEINGKLDGTVKTVEFQLEGQDFVALNGGPQFKFTEVISFIVNCQSQEELDYYWGKLSEGGDEKAQVCGWLKDKYGISWQIIPDNLTEMLSDSNSERSERVMNVIMQVKGKIDIEALMQAYEG